MICATIEVPRNVDVAVGHRGSLGLPGVDFTSLHSETTSINKINVE